MASYDALKSALIKEYEFLGKLGLGVSILSSEKDWHLDVLDDSLNGDLSYRFYFFDDLPALKTVQEILIDTDHYAVIVVNANAMPWGDIIPAEEWTGVLAAIHASYYGRVYVYEPGKPNLYAYHYQPDGYEDLRVLEIHQIEATEFRYIDGLQIEVKARALTMGTGKYSVRVLAATFCERDFWHEFMGDSNYYTRVQWAKHGIDQRRKTYRERPAAGFSDNDWGYQYRYREREKREYHQSPFNRNINDYEVLGLSSTATDAEVKSVYRNLMRQWHPDICKEDNATAMTQKINAAYQNIRMKRSIK